MNNQSNENGMGGILKWLIPLIIIGAGIWFFTKGDALADTNTTSNTEQVVSDIKSNTDPSPSKSRSSSTNSSNNNAAPDNSNNTAAPQDRVYMDDNGNIVDG